MPFWKKSRYFQPEALYSSQHKKEHSGWSAFSLGGCILQHFSSLGTIEKRCLCSERDTIRTWTLTHFLISDAHGQAEPVNPVVENILKNVRVYWKVIKNLMKWNECMKGFVICLTPLLATSSYATHQSLSLGLRNTLCSIRSYGTPLLKHHFSFYNWIEEKINLILETGCNFNSYSFQWRQSGQQRGQDRTVPGGTLTLWGSCTRRKSERERETEAG